MAKTSMEIVMSEDLKQRLHAAAARHGKTVQAFAQEALYTYVEDIEDGVMSDVALTEAGLTFLLPEREGDVGLDSPVLEDRRKTA